MLTLYVKSGCAYCAAAIKKLDDLGLPYTELNIADRRVEKALIEKGGKHQVPYLVDEENLVAMYESAAIVDYLEEQYGAVQNETVSPVEVEVAVAPVSGMRLHRVSDENICEACE